MKQLRTKLKLINVKPQKSRGQNFAAKQELIEEIVKFGDVKEGEPLIEIGPGLGALTEKLVEYDSTLTVVEVENAFCDELAIKFPKIKIYNQPFQELNLELVGNTQKKLTVFGNVPYVFSTDIIFHLLKYPKLIQRAVLLLQKEFAERVAAEPGGREYGVLSIMAQNWCTVRLGATFDGSYFYPPPKVHSRLLELTLREEPQIPENEFLKFQKIVKAAFLNRRKMLHNTLKNAGVYPENGAEILRDLNIPEDIRAEKLSIQQFRELALRL